MHVPLATESSTTTGRSSGGGGGILLISAVVAALGSLLFGFDTAVISGTTEALRQVYELNENLLGFTVSSALLGTMVGSLLVGRPADGLLRGWAPPVYPTMLVRVPLVVARISLIFR